MLITTPYALIFILFTLTNSLFFQCIIYARNELTLPLYNDILHDSCFESY
jgi:hypothetical protein